MHRKNPIDCSVPFPRRCWPVGSYIKPVRKTLILLSPEPYFVGYSMAPTSWTTDKPNYGAVDSRSIDMSIMHLVRLGRTVSVSVSLPQLINHHSVSYSGNVAGTIMRGWSSMTVLFRRAMAAVCTQLQTKGETTCEKWSEFSIQGRQVGKQHISQVWIK